MGPDRLDKFIKSKVFDHQSATDTDVLWEGILAKQETEEKPKRRFLWWWFAGALVLMISASSYLFFAISESNNNNTTNNLAILNNDEVSASTKPTEALSSLDGKTNESEFFSKSNQKENISQNNKNTNDSEATEKKTTANRKSITNETAPSNNLNTQKKSKTNNKINASTQVNISNIDAELKTNQKDGRPDQTNTPNLFNNNTEPKILPQSKSVIAMGTKEEILTSPNRFKKESHNNPTTNFKLHSLAASFSKEFLAPKPEKVRIPETPTEETTPKKERSPFSVGVYAGYGFSKNQLKTNTSNEDAESYLQLREDSETAMQVLHGGVDLKYQFPSGLYVKAALQYEQITERFDFSRTSGSTFFNDTATIAIYQLPDGSFEKESGTESMMIRTQSRKIYNRYRTIDVPLTLGYQWLSKKSLSWFVEGGVSINAAFMPRGEVLDYGGEEQIDLSDSSYFKKNIGLSLNAGIGLSYRVTKHWSLWLSPSFRYPLTKMTTDDYLLDQRFLRGAMTVGGRFAM